MHVATKKAPLRRGFLLRVDHQIGRRIRSLSVGALFGASSAREHQHDDEAGGDNCGLQIQRQREVGGGTEELEEGGHYDPLLLPARSSSPARHDANYLSG